MMPALPDTKSRQGCHKKIKFETLIPDDRRRKYAQQSISKPHLIMQEKDRIPGSSGID